MTPTNAKPDRAANQQQDQVWVQLNIMESLATSARTIAPPPPREGMYKAANPSEPHLWTCRINQSHDIDERKNLDHAAKIKCGIKSTSCRLWPHAHAQYYMQDGNPICGSAISISHMMLTNPDHAANQHQDQFFFYCPVPSATVRDCSSASDPKCEKICCRPDHLPAIFTQRGHKVN